MLLHRLPLLRHPIMHLLLVLTCSVSSSWKSGIGSLRPDSLGLKRHKLVWTFRTCEAQRKSRPCRMQTESKPRKGRPAVGTQARRRRHAWNASVVSTLFMCARVSEPPQYRCVTSPLRRNTILFCLANISCQQWPSLSQTHGRHDTPIHPHTVQSWSSACPHPNQEKPRHGTTYDTRRGPGLNTKADRVSPPLGVCNHDCRTRCPDTLQELKLLMRNPQSGKPPYGPMCSRSVFGANAAFKRQAQPVCHTPL